MPDEIVDESLAPVTPAEEGIPQNAGIAEILRWAMSHKVPLQYPPWEEAFCGSQNPCIYAGMVQGDGVRKSNIRSMLKKHAEWLVGQMAMVTPAEGGMPDIIEYPARTFYIAVCDSGDHSDPKISMFVYDRMKTLRRSRPCVEEFDMADVERHHGHRNSPYFRMRPLALEGFKIELGNVIRDYLLNEDAEREQALAELAETHPEVMIGQLPTAEAVGLSQTSGTCVPSVVTSGAVDWAPSPSPLARR